MRYRTCSKNPLPHPRAKLELWALPYGGSSARRCAFWLRCRPLNSPPTSAMSTITTSRASPPIPPGTPTSPEAALPARLSEAVVMKLDPSGKIVLFTILSGKGNDAANGLAVDAAGNIYVAGSTSSPDFPLHNAFQSTPGPGFLVKLSADGSQLLYSTYFPEAINALAVDAAGNVYVTGTTYLTSFPVTPGLPAGSVSLTPAAITMRRVPHQDLRRRLAHCLFDALFRFLGGLRRGQQLLHRRPLHHRRLRGSGRGWRSLPGRQHQHRRPAHHPRRFSDQGHRRLRGQGECRRIGSRIPHLHQRHQLHLCSQRQSSRHRRRHRGGRRRQRVPRRRHFRPQFPGHRRRVPDHIQPDPISPGSPTRSRPPTFSPSSSTPPARLWSGPLTSAAPARMPPNPWPSTLPAMSGSPAPRLHRNSPTSKDGRPAAIS